MLGAYKFIVGIDTGVNTGIAIWNRAIKNFDSIQSVKIHIAMKIVTDLCALHGNNAVFIRVEDARKRKWFGAMRGSEVLQGVGSVKRDAVIWEDFLLDLKVPFEMLHPIKGGTKINQESFASITKWRGKTNEHSRDAGMLCWNF